MSEEKEKDEEHIRKTELREKLNDEYMFKEACKLIARYKEQQKSKFGGGFFYGIALERFTKEQLIVLCNTHTTNNVA